MALTVCTLSGQVYGPEGGSPLTEPRLLFTLSNREIDGTNIVVPEVVETPLATDGTFSVDIWPNALGSGNSFYTVKIVFKGTTGLTFLGEYDLGQIQVPNSGTADISKLFSPVFIPPTSELVIAQAVAARDAAVAAQTAAEAAQTAAEAARDALPELSATATDLAEGASATASYDNQTGILALGIPTGATGAQGPQGPQGPAGADGADADVSALVQRAGDTMTGDLVLQDTDNDASGRSIVFEKSHDTTAPLNNDEMGSLYVRSLDPENGNSIRTRALISARASEDHDHITSNIGFKGQLLHVEAGAGGTNNLAAEWDESGFIVRANGSARFMNTVSMPLAWGANEANSPTANDAVFNLFEAKISNRLVDLGRENFKVPNAQVPNANIYQNGYLREVFAEGNVHLSHAQLNTLLKATVPLTHGLCNSAWAQDNACWDAGMREGFVAFSENNAHGPSDGSARPVIMRSRDGLGWTREEIDLGFPCIVFGHRVYGGFQMLIVRDESGGTTNGKYYLYGRQLSQRVELSGLSNTGPGDNSYRFTHNDLADPGRPLMLYETASVQFNGLPSNLGGLNLNAEDAVSYRSAATFEFRAPTNFTSQFTHSGTFEMNVRESDWFHITFDGGLTLGEAIEAAGGVSGEPTIIHGIAMFAGGEAVGASTDIFASRGDFYVGVSGGPFNAAVAKIRNIVDQNNKGDVQFCTEIAGANAALNEVTVSTLPGQLDVVGFVRTADANAGQTVPAAFFHTADDLATVTLTNLPTGAFEDSPIPCCVLGPDIVAAASLERGDNGQRGARRMVLLKASITDAIANGAAAFEDQIIPFEWAEYKNQTLTGGATGVGVPSITPWGNGTDKTVAVFWNQEANTNDAYRLDTVTQIMATKVGFNPNPMAYFGAEQIAWGKVPKEEWKLSLRGCPATANGSTILWTHTPYQSAPHCYNEATGIITFPVSGLYRVSAQMSYEPNTGSNYLMLRDGADNDYATLDKSGLWIAATYGGGTLQSMGASDTLIKAKGGDTMFFRVNATAGTTNSAVRNFATIELLEAF